MNFFDPTISLAEELREILKEKKREKKPVKTEVIPKGLEV